MIKVLAVAVAFTLSGGHWRVDVSIQTAVPVPGLVRLGAAAITLPGVTLYDPAQANVISPEGLTLWQHELHHWRQERALGPWFWVAYAASGGAAFEPYHHLSPIGPFLPVGPVDWVGWQQAWMPPKSMLDDYPLFRVTASGIHFLPGY